MRRRIALDRLPPRRIVVSFKYGGVPARYRGPRLFWLVLERTQAELCIKDPGFEIDLCVEADLAAMAKVWLGDITFEHAQVREKCCSPDRGRSRMHFHHG